MDQSSEQNDLLSAPTSSVICRGCSDLAGESVYRTINSAYAPYVKYLTNCRHCRDRLFS